MPYRANGTWYESDPWEGFDPSTVNWSNNPYGVSSLGEAQSQGWTPPPPQLPTADQTWQNFIGPSQTYGPLSGANFFTPEYQAQEAMKQTAWNAGDAGNMQGYLAAVGQAMGQPEYDWLPYLQQAQQAHQSQFGIPWVSDRSNWAAATNDVLGRAGQGQYSVPQDKVAQITDMIQKTQSNMGGLDFNWLMALATVMPALAPALAGAAGVEAGTAAGAAGAFDAAGFAGTGVMDAAGIGGAGMGAATTGGNIWSGLEGLSDLGGLTQSSIGPATGTVLDAGTAASGAVSSPVSMTPTLADLGATAIPAGAAGAGGLLQTLSNLPPTPPVPPGGNGGTPAAGTEAPYSDWGPGNDPNMGPISTGGPDFSLPGGGSIWDMIQNLGGNLLNNAGTNLSNPNNLTSIISAIMSDNSLGKYRDDLISTMNRAVDRSDPFYNERPFYQEKARNLATTPSNFLQDPGIADLINHQQDVTARKLSSQGYNMSGNMASELTKIGQREAFGQWQPYLQTMLNAGGAGINPSGATQAFGQFGPMIAQAGMDRSGYLGNVIGSVFNNPQQPTGQSGSGGFDLSSIINGVKGIFNL